MSSNKDIIDFIGGRVEYEEGSIYGTNQDSYPIVDVRGITTQVEAIIKDEYELFLQDQLGRFIEEAINEKIQREKCNGHHKNCLSIRHAMKCDDCGVIIQTEGGIEG